MQLIVNSLLDCHDNAVEQDNAPRCHLHRLVELVDRKIDKCTFELVVDLVAAHAI